MKPERVELQTFGQMIDGIKEYAKERNRKLVKNGGICLNCGDNPADPNGLSHYNCTECNEKAQMMIDQLKGPGFMQLNVPVEGD